jgi:hypothetical protein
MCRHPPLPPDLELEDKVGVTNWIGHSSSNVDYVHTMIHTGLADASETLKST